MKNEKVVETKVYGENSCRAVFESRPDSIIRCYFTEASAPRYKTVMKYCAAHKRAYHIRPEAELEKVSQTQHHEGVCFLIKRRPVLDVAGLAAHVKGGRALILALDGVANPHNVGAMLRTCAGLGVKYVLMEKPELAQNGAALRTAQGGFEHIQLVRCKSLPAALKELRVLGFSSIATSSHEEKSLQSFKWPDRSILVVGSEEQGVRRAILKGADHVLNIGGTGAVESFNAATAVGIVLYSWYVGEARVTQ